MNNTESRTAQVTTTFNEFRRTTEEDIAALKAQLEATQVSTVDSDHQEATIAKLRAQNEVDKAQLED